MKIQKSFYINIPDEAYTLSASFGIEQTHKLDVVDVEFPDTLPEITYITGQSGSGKSVLFNELCNVFNINTVVQIPDTPLVCWTDDIDYNVSILSSCGLSDITQMLSTYENLSDSQKARAIIYYHIINKNNIIAIDEFLSTLDRTTAKSVAFCLQKALRRYQIKLIACTAHDDLTEYLKPNLLIVGKSYPSKFIISQHKNDNIYPFNVVIKETTKEIYRNSLIGELHYKGKYTGGTKDFLTAYVDGEEAGHLVTTNRMGLTGRKISRVVVHPSFRGLGVAKQLVQKLINLYPDDIIDVTASMAKYNPFLEKAGLRFDKIAIFKTPKYLTNLLTTFGFDFTKMSSRKYCVEFCLNDEFRNELSKHASKFQRYINGTREISPQEIEYKIKTEPYTAGRIIHRSRETHQHRYTNS